MEGSGQLDARSFSGFDFARLVRNFEITAESLSAEGQIRATAIAIYLVPALALNAAILLPVGAVRPDLKAVGSLAAIAAAGYSVVVLFTLLAFSLLPLNEFEEVVGLPAYGFLLTALAALTLGWNGLSELRAGVVNGDPY